VKDTHHCKKHLRRVFSVEVTEFSEVNGFSVSEDKVYETLNLLSVTLSVVFIIVLSHVAEVEAFTLASVFSTKRRLLLRIPSARTR